MEALPTGPSPSTTEHAPPLDLKAEPRVRMSLRAVATLGITLLSIVWIVASHWVSNDAISSIIGALSLQVPALLAGWICLSVSRRAELDRRSLNGWVFMGLAACSGSVFGLTVALPSAAAQSGMTAIVGAASHVGILIFGTVAVLHWVRRLSPAATAGTVLDLMCVAVLAYVVSWETILTATLAEGSGIEGTIDTITMLTTPALGTLALVGVVTVLSQVGRQQLRGAELLATFGLGGMVASDLAMAVRGIAAGGHDTAWHLTFVSGSATPIAALGWVLGLGAIGFGATLRGSPPRVGTRVPLMERSTTWELLVSLVPFVLLSCVLITPAVNDEPLFTQWTLTALGCLLLVRCALIAVQALRAARTSTTDPLTSALSHRELQERLPLEIEHARACGHPISLLVIDVDDFGLLNDSYSHAEGDRFLQELAWLIRSVLVPGQSLYRSGGDEFAVVLPACDQPEAERLGGIIARAAHRIRATASVAPTLTIGIATAPEHAIDAHELVQLASGTLYWGKLNGKASVTCYDPQVVKILDAESRLEVMEQSSRLRAVFALARALDARDAYTARHSENVARYSVAIATELGWSPERLELIRVAGQLHDIGKIGMRDSTLRKGERLSEAEWHEMQHHPQLGARMVTGVASEEILPWILSHHEHVDGTGYPHHLVGDDIPDGARVLAVADTFDAMTSSRSYRPALSPLRAIDEVVRGAGEQFDPTVVRAFLAALKAGSIDVHSVAHDAATSPAQERYVSPTDNAYGDDVALFVPIAVDPEFRSAADAIVSPTAHEDVDEVDEETFAA